MYQCVSGLPTAEDHHYTNKHFHSDCHCPSQLTIKTLSRPVLGFPGGTVVKNLLPMQEAQETWVRSLAWEDPLV